MTNSPILVRNNQAGRSPGSPAPSSGPSCPQLVWMSGAGVALALLMTQPAQARPTALLINGAVMYLPDPLTPLSGMASTLRALGFRVVVATHLTSCEDEEPVLIVGHSAGGAAALDCAQQLVEQVKFHPVVITLDAAPRWRGVWRCRVEVCLNVRTFGYPKITGAKDVPMNTSHVGLAFSSDVERIVIRYAVRLVKR